MAKKIRGRVRSLKEVADCDEVKIGFTMKKPNIHFHVMLKADPSFEETHKICYKIDKEVRSLVPNARVVIHSEQPGTDYGKDIWKIVKKVADGEPGSRGVQNIHLRPMESKLGVDLQLQVSTPMIGDKAHEFETHLTQNLRTAEPRVSEVVIHQDSVAYLVSSEQWGHGTELRSYVEHVSKRFPELVWLGSPTIWRMSDGLHLADRVALKRGTDSARTTQVISEFGAAIRNGYPEITRTDIVEEQRSIGEM
ncbi:MAG TPA: cation transporter dimerization domain-containing protein [Candidatus Bathyarchaeia archaeon]|nr:cation transporter dimerization domain-containing protein [Candidatus Bathyarchaeia archaeon]